MKVREIIPLYDNDLINTPPIDQNPALVYLARLGSEHSRRTQRQALEVIAYMLIGDDLLRCNWAALRYQHTQLIRSMLAEKYAPASANRMLSALRGVLKAAWRLGQMSAEEYHRAADISGVLGSSLPAGRELSPGELAALMAACENDPTPAGVRDAAIIALGYSCGLRRAELAGLNYEDYAGGKLVIRGKRSKQRTAYLVNGAARAISDWLAIRGSAPGALFYPINKGGVLIRRRMTTQAIYV